MLVSMWNNKYLTLILLYRNTKIILHFPKCSGNSYEDIHTLIISLRNSTPGCLPKKIIIGVLKIL